MTPHQCRRTADFDLLRGIQCFRPFAEDEFVYKRIECLMAHRRGARDLVAIDVERRFRRSFLTSEYKKHKRILSFNQWRCVLFNPR